MVNYSGIGVNANNKPVESDFRPISGVEAKSKLKTALLALPGVERVCVGTDEKGVLSAQVWRKGAKEPDAVPVGPVEKVNPVSKDPYTEPNVDGAVAAYAKKIEKAK